MLLGLLGSELALADQLVHQRVVVGQAQQLAVAQAVGTRVAHMGDHHVPLSQIDGGDRGAHTRVLDVRVGELVDACVGLLHLSKQAGLWIGAVRETAPEGVNRQPGGDLSGLCPAHPVGDHEQGERTSMESSLARLCRPVSVPDQCSATRSISVHLEAEFGVADAHAIAGMQRTRPVQQLLVEVGAIGRAQVFDHQDPALLIDAGVTR